MVLRLGEIAGLGLGHKTRLYEAVCSNDLWDLHVVTTSFLLVTTCCIQLKLVRFLHSHDAVQLYGKGC